MVACGLADSLVTGMYSRLSSTVPGCRSQPEHSHSLRVPRSLRYPQDANAIYHAQPASSNGKPLVLRTQTCLIFSSAATTTPTTWFPLQPWQRASSGSSEGWIFDPRSELLAMQWSATGPFAAPDAGCLAKRTSPPLSWQTMRLRLG